MNHGTVFLNNKTQAIRLPKSVELDSSVRKVSIVAVGRTRIIAPVGELWDSWFDGPSVSADFMNEREANSTQEREAF